MCVKLFMLSITPDKLRLLMVRHSEKELTGFEQEIARSGFREVLTVSTLRQAEQKLSALLSNGQVHAVLLPARMEDAGGPYAAGQLRRNGDFDDVTLVVVVENTAQINWLEAFEMGVDEILSPEQTPQEWIGRILHAIAERQNLMRTREREQDLAASNERLSFLASIDELTGLHNARYFNAALDSQWQWTAERGKPLSLLMLDIDRFKQVNDTYTHLAGNEVLEAVAGRILHSIRQSTDLASRYGGEEFAIILPGAAARQALRVAETLREKIAGSPIKSQEAGSTIEVTASVGVISAQAGLHPGLREAEDVLREADKALYQAKQDGRDCVRISPLSVGSKELKTTGEQPAKISAKPDPRRVGHKVFITPRIASS